MSAREIASLWLVAIAGVTLILWDHRAHMQTVLGALSGRAGPVATSAPEVPDGMPQGTNDPIPMAGNEFGFIATLGRQIDGDTQPQGPDVAFGDLFFSLNDEAA